MANSARGVMKIPAEPSSPRPSRSPPGRRARRPGVKYETIEELKDVVQLDKLDDGRALILVKADTGELNLVTVALP